MKRLIIINSLNGPKGIPDYPEGAKYIYGPQGHAHPFPTYDSVKDQLSNLYFDQSLVEENRIKMALKIVQSTHKIAKERATTINKSIESPNAIALFPGIVHGVVVHITTEVFSSNLLGLFFTLKAT